eukprot:GFYU01007322.1.p1 GENE.GFYU01007322.1~~GFYU01007322.1.p1  ORF type:complete len:437 (+),score=106.17 GFYU01007322.1:55-1365(+)
MSDDRPSWSTSAYAPLGNNDGKAQLVNVVLMSMGFLGVFLAFNASQGLQTTINKDWGYWYQSTLYLAFSLATLVAPPLCSYLGPRGSLVLGGCTYLGVIIGNISPTPYALLPLNALLGFGAAILWTGQGVYTTRCAVAYAHQRNEEKGSAMGYFNGLFFSLFQCNGMVGNIMAGAILGSGGDVKLLFIVFTITCGLGLVIFCVLRKVETTGDPFSQGLPLFETVNLFVSDVRIRLLTFIIAYGGLSLGFVTGTFPATVINDKAWSPYVIACFFGVDMAASMLIGKLSDMFGRRPMFILGLLVQGFCIIFLLIWEIDTSAHFIHFMLATLFGIGDAVWNTQICAILGSLFHSQSEAAFSIFKLWQSLGLFAAFFFGVPQDAFNASASDDPLVSFDGQLVVLCVFLVVGVGCVFGLDHWYGPIDNKKNEGLLDNIDED